MRDAHMKSREYQPRVVVTALVLGVLAALSACLTLGAYDLTPSMQERLSVQGGAVSHLVAALAALVWRFGQALGPMGFQQSLLIIVAVYGFLRILPLIETKDIRWMVPLSLVGGITTVLAESYSRVNSWALVFGGVSCAVISAVKAAGTAALFFAALILLNRFWLAHAQDEDVSGKGTAKTIGITCLIILLCWSPYIISLYPASVVGDVADQVAQVMGAKEYCWTATHIAANPSGLLLNNHHPVMHTLLVGACVKLGGVLHSYNAGLFIYAGLQCVVLALTLACQVVLIRRLCAQRVFPLCALVFFALNPLFPMWGMTIDKDIYFALLTWWIVAGFFLIVRSEQVRTRLFVGWGLAMLLWLLARNGGLYVIIASLPFLLWALRGKREVLVRVVATMGIVALVYVVGIQKLLFGAFGIASGGTQEALSVPFMQTARLARDHREDIGDEDRRVLKGLFGGDKALDTMAAEYDKRPTRSDGVKFLYDNNATVSLGTYIKTWAHGLTAHPGTYLQALMNLDYGWIYPDENESVLAYTGISKLATLQKMLPDVHEPESLAPARTLAASFIGVCERLPLVGLLFEFSSYTWAYIIALALMIRRRKTVELASMSFIYLNYGICFLGPVACLRYALPAIVAFPTLVGFMALDSGRAEES